MGSTHISAARTHFLGTDSRRHGFTAAPDPSAVGAPPSGRSDVVGRRAPSGRGSGGEGEIRPVAADRLAGNVETGHGARDHAGITLVLPEPHAAWVR